MTMVHGTKQLCWDPVSAVSPFVNQRKNYIHHHTMNAPRERSIWEWCIRHLHFLFSYPSFLFYKIIFFYFHFYFFSRSVKRKQDTQLWGQQSWLLKYIEAGATLKWRTDWKWEVVFRQLLTHRGHTTWSMETPLVALYSLCTNEF
jgi:hypothetical protein